MLLALDVGNSNITIGLFRAGALLATRRAATAPRATPDEIELVLTGLLSLDDIGLADLDSIVVASVVPAITSAVEVIAERHDRPLLVASAGTVPLAVRVDRPGGRRRGPAGQCPGRGATLRDACRRGRLRDGDHVRLRRR